MSTMTGQECRSQAAAIIALSNAGGSASERAETAELAATWRRLGALADLDQALADVIAQLQSETPVRSAA